MDGQCPAKPYNTRVSERPRSAR